MSQAASQAAAFYRDAAKGGPFWTVRDERGFPAPVGSSGKRAMPFWSTKTRVDRIIAAVPAYSGFEPVEVSLGDFMDKWLPGLEKDELLVGLNWTGARATGFDISPQNVRIALNATIASAAGTSPQPG